MDTYRPEDIIETDHIVPLWDIVPQKAGGHKYKDNLQVIHKHCHDKRTKDDLKAIQVYKNQKGWEKVFKEFKFLFEESEWTWIDDIPTLV